MDDNVPVYSIYAQSYEALDSRLTILLNNVLSISTVEKVNLNEFLGSMQCDITTVLSSQRSKRSALSFY